MELHLDFQKNLLKTICWLLSLISWLLFIITGWIGFFKLSLKKYSDSISYNCIWCFINTYYESFDSKQSYAPIQLNLLFYIILFGFLLICSTAGFCLFVFKSSFQNDEKVFEGMMGTFTRFHFIPFICATALFIQGLIQESYFVNDLLNIDINFYNKLNDDMLDKAKENLTGFITTLFFSILGLISIVVIYMNTHLEKTTYFEYAIKNGLFPTLIVLFVYSIFYSGIYIGVFNKFKQYINDSLELDFSSNFSKIYKIAKNCGIAFSLLIGVINLYLGLFLKELFIPILNAIIYLGFAIYFFGTKKEERDNIDVSPLEGANDIIVFIISILTIVILAILKKDKNYTAVSS